MGTIADKLQKVIDTKAAIKQAIENKGVEIADDATFAEYATTLDDAVITPLVQLEYSAEDEAVYKNVNIKNGTLKNDIAYSKTLRAKYDGLESYSYALSNDKTLKYFPLLDTSNGTNFNQMFYNCTALTTIPALDTSNGTNFNQMFYNCTALTTIPALDTSNGTNFNQMFDLCTSLTTIEGVNTANGTTFAWFLSSCRKLLNVPQLDLSNAITLTGCIAYCFILTKIPALNTSKAEEFSSMLRDNIALTTVEELDFSSGKTFSNFILNSTKITFMLLKNIGTQSEATSIPLNPTTVWGSGSNENRQSLVDTLLTYSYDRAAAGMGTCTVTLAAAVKARLTDEEIAAITAKGYTLA